MTLHRFAVWCHWSFWSSSAPRSSWALVHLSWRGGRPLPIWRSLLLNYWGKRRPMKGPKRTIRAWRRLSHRSRPPPWLSPKEGFRWGIPWSVGWWKMGLGWDSWTDEKQPWTRWCLSREWAEAAWPYLADPDLDTWNLEYSESGDWNRLRRWVGVPEYDRWQVGKAEFCWLEPDDWQAGQLESEDLQAGQSKSKV